MVNGVSDTPRAKRRYGVSPSLPAYRPCTCICFPSLFSRNGPSPNPRSGLNGGSAVVVLDGSDEDDEVLPVDPPHRPPDDADVKVAELLQAEEYARSLASPPVQQRQHNRGGGYRHPHFRPPRPAGWGEGGYPGAVVSRPSPPLRYVAREDRGHRGHAGPVFHCATRW